MFNSPSIQAFIYNYVLEKLKCEKLQMLVDPKFQDCLNSLAQPLALNSMRTMKEANYTALREIISNHMASPSLTLIKKNLEALDMDADIFELVYEGFWDLYTFHPKCEDVSAKKLLAWIPKINLQVPEGTPEPVRNNDEEGEEAVQEAPAQEENKAEPPVAVVQIRIPKQMPDPVMDEEGNPVEQEIDYDALDEVAFEDKAWMMSTNIDSQKIWAINQLAGRSLR